MKKGAGENKAGRDSPLIESRPAFPLLSGSCWRDFISDWVNDLSTGVLNFQTRHICHSLHKNVTNEIADLEMNSRR